MTCIDHAMKGAEFVFDADDFIDQGRLPFVLDQDGSGIIQHDTHDAFSKVWQWMGVDAGMDVRSLVATLTPLASCPPVFGARSGAAAKSRAATPAPVDEGNTALAQAYRPNAPSVVLRVAFFSVPRPVDL
ncbi:MAG: hypothetical protein ACPGUV_08480 [Polyangiales bacterium]